MAVFKDFVGQSYSAQSSVADAQSAMNLYPEGVESGEGQNVAYMRRSPGLALSQLLPTSPVRAIASSTGTNISGMYAVAGAYLYQIWPAGTVTTSGTTVTWVSGASPFTAGMAGAAMTIGGTLYTVSTVNVGAQTLALTGSAGVQASPVASTMYLRMGAVGNDGLPAQIVFTGNQLVVVSDGQIWVATAATTVTPALYPNRFGEVTIAGITVTWSSGTLFDASMVTQSAPVQPIYINGVPYIVASFISPTQITLGYAPPATAVPVPYNMALPLAGTLSTDGTDTVTWVAGPQFDASMLAETVEIAGAPYVVNDVSGVPLTLGLTAAAPIVAYFMMPDGNGGFDPVPIAVSISNSPTGTLTWISGPAFTAALTSAPVEVVIGGVLVEAGGGPIHPRPRYVSGGTNFYVLSVDVGAQTLVLTGTIGGVSAVNVAATSGQAAFTISTPVGAAQGVYLDGVIIASTPNTNTMNNSNIQDATTWNLLNYASKQAYPDHINALLADHEELYVMGTDTGEVWQTNPASVAFACQRVPGDIMLHGCIARYSLVSLGEGIAFLGGDSKRGWTIAYRATGFIPVRVSTHAIETVWASYPTTSDAVSFVYIDQGHEFWAITFVSGNATWVYDATAAAWHQRGWWNAAANSGAGGIDRQRQMFHAFCYGQHYVGDWSTGDIYIQSSAFGTDNGTPIVRQRAAPHLNTENLWSYYSRFEILMDFGGTWAAGTCTPDGTTTVAWASGTKFDASMVGSTFVIGGAPYIVATFSSAISLIMTSAVTTGTAVVFTAFAAFTLDFSDDGGYTWHAGLVAIAQGVAPYGLRAIWRRLGRSRDRVFRVTWTASANIALVNAFLDVTQGD